VIRTTDLELYEDELIEWPMRDRDELLKPERDDNPWRDAARAAADMVRVWNEEALAESRHAVSDDLWLQVLRGANLSQRPEWPRPRDVDRRMFLQIKHLTPVEGALEVETSAYATFDEVRAVRARFRIAVAATMAATPLVAGIVFSVAALMPHTWRPDPYFAFALVAGGIALVITLLAALRDS
jgi:hypothetical protein